MARVLRAFVCVVGFAAAVHVPLFTSRKETVNGVSWSTPCSRQYQPFIDQCHPPKDMCSRYVIDDFVPTTTVDELVSIAERALAGRSKEGGPAIVDINSGFARDGDGLENIYTRERYSMYGQPLGGRKGEKQEFTSEEFSMYGNVVEKIRAEVVSMFGLGNLYLSAPNFITRLIGNPQWQAAEIHDEYWHPHIDKNNTGHYDYSGLLYLADYELDFSGGLFAFLDPLDPVEEVDRSVQEKDIVRDYFGEKRKVAHYVEPKKGRLVIFSAGMEHEHQVQKVLSGSRYVMSLWFTCDSRHHFDSFLDGKAHYRFSGEDDGEL